MATSIVFNGSTYSVPANREPRGWGTSLSAFLVDVGNNALSKAGGNFTITADANFGANFGLVVKYIKSASSNIAQSGVVRLANNEAIVWRNAANDGDIEFKVNASDDIELGGTLRLDEVTVFSDTNQEMDVGSTLFDLSSTGAFTFNGFTVTGGNTTFTVGGGTGIIVDHVTNEFFNITWPAFTGQVPAASTGITYVYITRDLALVLTTTPPTPNVRRDNIVLGKVGVISGTITGITANTVTTKAANADLFDLGESLSTFRIDGSVISANGANLNVNRSLGHVFQLGINLASDPNNPNTKAIPAGTAVTMIRATSTSITGSSALIDPANYDVAGTVTAISGAASRATIQRFYQFPGTSTNLAVQYGQAVYNSLSEAVQAIGTEAFTVNPNISSNAILVGVLCVTKGCTSLSDSSTARFFNASKFGEAAVGAAGTSVSTLQNAYNNSSDPEVLTDSTRGAVSIKRGSSADTDNVLEVLNGAGSTTLGIRGNGTVTGATLLTSTVDDYIDINEESAPSTPSAGKVRVYAKSDAKIYKKDSAGTETQLATTAEALSNPMTTSGDVIYGGVSGAATRLAANSTATKKWLRSLSSGVPSWEEVDIVKGQTSTVAASYVGERLTFTSRAVNAVTSGYTANTSALQTLTAGIWLIVPRYSGAGNASTTGADCFISTDSTNADSGHLETGDSTTFYDPAFGTNIQGRIIYYIASGSTPIYFKAKSFGAALTTTCTGYAVRIA